MDFTLTKAAWGGLTGVDLTATDAAGTGWSWAAAAKTLTLTNLSFTTAAYAGMKLPDGTVLVLNGANTVTSAYSGADDSCGISALGDLTVSGSGSLSCTGGTSTDREAAA